MQQTPDAHRADVAASFQEAIVDVLLTKALKACFDTGLETLIVAGGVAANSRLRAEALRRTTAAGIELRTPPIGLCTDNGAMVAALTSLAVSGGVAPSTIGFSTLSTAPLDQPVWR